MPTLHIERPVTDFTAHRAQAGALAERIQQPIDDPSFVVIDLDFPTAEAATGFLAFLQNQVCSSPANSPTLAGQPLTRIMSRTS